MDNSKRSGNSQNGSLDGFTRPAQQLGKKPNSLRNFDQHYRGASTSVNDSYRISKIDDFKSPDGFVPNTQAPIYSPSDAYKPAEIGEINEAESDNQKEYDSKPPKQKRKGFLFLRRKQKEPKRNKNHRKLRIGLRAVGVLALLLILVGGGLGLKVFFKGKNILRGGGTGAVALNKIVDPLLLKGEGDGRVNILVLGKGGPGHDGPDLTDTLVVASIDPLAKETALLSIPRDLWVKSDRGQSKINSVYANAKYSVLNNYTTKQQTAAVKQQAEDAGIKAIEAMVTKTMGIPVHYYMMVDFTAFRQSIDTVGGIDINVKTALYDATIAWENNNKSLIAAVGQQHFDGKRALLYARSRHGSARGDFDRNERQREVILALKTKVLSLNTFANPVKLNQLIDAFGDHISTDFSLNEMMRVYDIVKQIPSEKITSLGLADPPNNFLTTGNVNNQSVVQPRAGLFDYTEIQSYIRNTLRDPFLKSENANIIILNGTDTPGLATLKSTELKSYGYNVTQVADAPTKTYTKTVLIDLTNGVKKYTKNYLEKRLGVTTVKTLPDTSIVPGTANFVIILGSNEPSAQ